MAFIKKSLNVFIVLTVSILLLSLLSACSQPASGTNASQDIPPTVTPSVAQLSSPQSSDASTPTARTTPNTDNSLHTPKYSNVRIGFMTQEYIGDNIAEIPMFEYNGERNEHIEGMNRSIVQGFQFLYDEFMKNQTKDSVDWMEIRSYPFTSEKYLQVVLTFICYPNYGTDGDIYSFNYDIKNDTMLNIVDAMEMDNLNLDDMLYEIGQLYEPETPGTTIAMTDIKGFLIRTGTNGEDLVRYMVELTTENPDFEPWKSFWCYTPAIHELIKMNSSCLFDPYDMDQMNPPLSYQKQDN